MANLECYPAIMRGTIFLSLSFLSDCRSDKKLRDKKYRARLAGVVRESGSCASALQIIPVASYDMQRAFVVC